MTGDTVPTFDDQEFSSQVHSAFLTTRRAWSLLKPDVCRRVMTEELWAHQYPSCGAPARVSDDGACFACGRHVTGGEFDWIVWQIEAPAASGSG